MEASSPLKRVNGEQEYHTDMTLTPSGNARSHRIEDVQIELTPRSESSFLPYFAAPESNSDDAAPFERKSQPIPAQEPINNADQAPSDEVLPAPNTPLKKMIEADSGSMRVEISPAPLPLSYTANAFALAQPSTPPPASFARGDTEQDQKAAEIPESPSVPSTPVLSEVGVASSSLHTPFKMSPRKRVRPRTTSSPSALKTSMAADETGDSAAAPKTADMNMDGTSDSAPRTTTRSGRQVMRPRNMQESTPSPPTTKTKGKGQAKEKASAKTPISAKTPRSVEATGSPAVTPAVLRRRKAEAARWKTDSLLSSTRSPLIKHDLRSILLRPDTWDVLGREEQAEILALFPSMENVSDPGTDTARPNVASLINDNNFRHDCARYTNDLENGFFEREWLAGAFEAHIMRNQGAFDDYIVGEFEKAWGVTVPDSLRGAKRIVEPDNEFTQEVEQDSDQAVPKETPSLPTINGNPTQVEQGDLAESALPNQSTGPTERTEKDVAANTVGNRQTKAVTDTINTKETAALDPVAADPDPEAPPPLSLRLGSPLTSEDEEDGQVKANTKTSTEGAQLASQETKDIFGKRKAATAKVQEGKRRKTPNVEPSEANNNDNDAGKQPLEQAGIKMADNTAYDGSMATEH